LRRNQPVTKSHDFYETQRFITEVGFEVLTAVSMKIAVFWIVAPCSLVEVNFYQTTRCYNPEDRNFRLLPSLQQPSKASILTHMILPALFPLDPF
jgi:hypothetical protein